MTRLERLAAHLDAACEQISDGADVSLAWWPLAAIREIAEELRTMEVPE